MTFDLSHLTQQEDQKVLGPVQDDEALLLYAICRMCQFKRVIEFGGLSGYSACNFLKAMGDMGDMGKVYSVEMNHMETVNERHVHVHKEAGSVLATDFDNQPVDLVFFDVHHLGQEFGAFLTLREHGVITDRTLLAFHDTGLHPKKETWWSVPLGDYWCHQQIERKMVNILKDCGYEGIDFGCNNPEPPLAFRHGLTLLRKKSRFEEPPRELRQTICMPGILIDSTTT